MAVPDQSVPTHPPVRPPLGLHFSSAVIESTWQVSCVFPSRQPAPEL